MASYRLKRPVRAARYDLRINEQEIFDLLNLGGASFNNMSGYVRVYNNRGRDLDVQPGQWVVRMGEDIVVLDAAAFEDLFERTDADS